MTGKRSLRIDLEAGADAEILAYLEAAARLRRISLAALFRRLVRTIGHDQLVASILDDADTLRRRRPGERNFRRASREVRP